MKKDKKKDVSVVLKRRCRTLLRVRDNHDEVVVEELCGVNKPLHSAVVEAQHRRLPDDLLEMHE